MTSEEVDALVAAYESGLILEELSSAFSIDPCTVAKHLERRGVERRGRRLSVAQIDDIAVLYRSGLSLTQVGDRYGVAPTTINYWLRKRGVQLRERNGWRK